MSTSSAPDDVDTAQRFDLIWSNPPIRVGKAQLHDLLQTWLGRLATTGAAVLVVQRHLGADSLQRWLVEQGWESRAAGLLEGIPADRRQARGGSTATLTREPFGRSAVINAIPSSCHVGAVTR